MRRNCLDFSPLPAQPYDTSEVVYRTVDAEGFVVCRQNFYAVPWRLIGQAVVVRDNQDQLTIYDQSFVVVASHQLFAKTVTGGRSLSPDHEPPRDSRERQQQLEAAVRRIRPSRYAIPEGPAEPQSRYGKNQAERVLSLVVGVSTPGCSRGLGAGRPIWGVLTICHATHPRSTESAQNATRRLGR